VRTLRVVESSATAGQTPPASVAATRGVPAPGILRQRPLIVPDDHHPQHNHPRGLRGGVAGPDVLRRDPP
jgi:hypothetical protein